MSAMTRPDPAPSRLKYRLERLMLTPLFWLVLRVGVPFGLAFGGASLWFAQEPNREAFLTFVNDIRTEIEQRPEFMVNLMAIDGASQSVAEDIREIIPQDFPVSSFELDLERLREIVVGLDAVKSASLRITQGGVLQVDVVERIPALVWRHAEGLELMDATGVMVGPLAARQDRQQRVGVVLDQVHQLGGVGVGVPHQRLQVVGVAIKTAGHLGLAGELGNRRIGNRVGHGALLGS